MANLCINAYKSADKADENGKKIILCQKTKQPCVAQRYCGERKTYIISENADRVCRNYK